jgi:tight adherence protein C
VLSLAVALALLGTLALGLVGARMLRSPVEWDRFDAAGVEAGAGGKRGSLVGKLATRLQPTVLSLAGDAVVARYRRKLDAAGRPEGLTAEVFLARKGAYTVLLGGTGLLLLLAGRPVFGVIAASLGFFLQDLWLRGAVKRRQQALERDLPDFLDVLSITVEGGLSFQGAMERVADAFDGPLAEEVASVELVLTDGQTVHAHVVERPADVCGDPLEPSPVLG